MVAIPSRAGTALICCGAAFLTFISARDVSGQAGDAFRTEVQQATAKVRAASPEFEKRLTAADVGGAVDGLLAVFPADKRTAAESFVLGNALFEVDRRQSYALHKAAAAAEPKNLNIVWEWALQQHRAGEWAAALASYEAYSEARPDTAASYALQADCLLRLGKVDEAAAAWKKSEDAPSGSVEVMESLVCAVHREPLPVARRAELLAKATGKGDVEAAADLIALDCDWPHDWWNAGPDEQYVKHDLDAVTAALKLPVDDARGRAIACAAACALADPEDAEAVRKALEKYGLVIDDGRTLPAHSGLRFIILHAATQSKVIELATVQKEIAPRLLEMARKTGDVKAWNTAVYFGPRDRSVEEALKIEREGWRATGDARFAAGTLLVKLKTGKLAGDDVELAAALKQFPESAMVWKIAYDVAKTEGKVTKELLAGAAKAEFTKFSSYVAPATVVNRPRAGYLRVYFAQLNRMAAAPAPPE